MKLKVMIVDDEEVDRYLVLRALGKFDEIGQVVEFDDGAGAVDALSEDDFRHEWLAPPPVLILLDINMPRMGGFEFLDNLSQIEEESSSPLAGCVILMLTSSDHFGDKERAASYSSVKGYIQKPISEEKLRAIILEHYPGVLVDN